MTENNKYQWDTMWDVTADPQAMFISALFSVKKDALEALMEIAPQDDTRREEWAASLGINAPWFIPKALKVAAASTETPWLTPFDFEYAAWDDRWTPKAEYEAAVRAEFDKHLAAYMMRDANPDLMQPDALETPRAFIWLVRYLVEGERQQEIAESEPRPHRPGSEDKTMSAQNVGRSIRALAKRIALDLPNRRGGSHKANTT